jgi:hypothetical protein
MGAGNQAFFNFFDYIRFASSKRTQKSWLVMEPKIGLTVVLSPIILLILYRKSKTAF